MFDRSERRHHVERLKETRKHYWGYGNPRARGPEHMDARQLGKVVQYSQACSCPACGSPRRHDWYKQERLTLQERRQLEALKKFEFEPQE